MEAVISMLDLVRRLVQRMGPYLLVEALLPGGTLLALLLFLVRRSRRAAGSDAAIAAGDCATPIEAIRPAQHASDATSPGPGSMPCRA